MYASLASSLTGAVADPMNDRIWRSAVIADDIEHQLLKLNNNNTKLTPTMQFALRS
jgi:hypothetical protein